MLFITYIPINIMLHLSYIMWHKSSVNHPSVQKIILCFTSFLFLNLWSSFFFHCRLWKDRIYTPLYIKMYYYGTFRLVLPQIKFICQNVGRVYDWYLEINFLNCIWHFYATVRIVFKSKAIHVPTAFCTLDRMVVSIWHIIHVCIQVCQRSFKAEWKKSNIFGIEHVSNKQFPVVYWILSLSFSFYFLECHSDSEFNLRLL